MVAERILDVYRRVFVVGPNGREYQALVRVLGEISTGNKETPPAADMFVEEIDWLDKVPADIYEMMCDKAALKAMDDIEPLDWEYDDALS